MGFLVLKSWYNEKAALNLSMKGSDYIDEKYRKLIYCKRGIIR